MHLAEDQKNSTVLFKIQFNHIPTKFPYLFTNADWLIKINLFTWQVGGEGNVLFYVVI